MQYFQDVLTVTVPTTGLFEAYDLIGFPGLAANLPGAPTGFPGCCGPCPCSGGRGRSGICRGA